MNKKMKLEIELVPSTSWYDNLRKYIKQKDWNKIREQTNEISNFKCAICGAKGKLNCHEIWKYDDKSHIQKLNGFTMLCNMCHFVKHIGFAGVLSGRGKLDIEKVVKHFIEVNKCNINEFESHKKKCFEIWKERSRCEWKIDLGIYENMIKTKKLGNKQNTLDKWE